MPSTVAAITPRRLENGWEVCRETPMESGTRVVLACGPEGSEMPFATLVETYGSVATSVRTFATRAEAEADYEERAFRGF